MTDLPLLARSARESDLPTLIGMLADDLLGQTREGQADPPDPTYLDAFQALSDDPNQQLVVFEQAGTIVGMLQLSFIPGLSHRGGWRGNIEAVRVARNLRGRGIGRQMFQWAIETCRTRNCRIVQLATNSGRDDAQRFYTSLGFVPSHVGFKLALVTSAPVDRQG